ncbi:hypothetical protein M9H77_36490 [Catharanthus roseus]|uniref:Uncharacterized protein n=1 Tax=Catharanthus roseus TaxID=4058 RepID=A0ACB9ZVQ1_CATRO|nr:hypothetical protein M9H77_36490 [Catharanthus roseus]
MSIPSFDVSLPLSRSCSAVRVGAGTSPPTIARPPTPPPRRSLISSLESPPGLSEYFCFIVFFGGDNKFVICGTSDGDQTLLVIYTDNIFIIYIFDVKVIFVFGNGLYSLYRRDVVGIFGVV